MLLDEPRALSLKRMLLVRRRARRHLAHLVRVLRGGGRQRPRQRLLVCARRSLERVAIEGAALVGFGTHRRERGRMLPLELQGPLRNRRTQRGRVLAISLQLPRARGRFEPSKLLFASARLGARLGARRAHGLARERERRLERHRALPRDRQLCRARRRRRGERDGVLSLGLSQLLVEIPSRSRALLF